MVEMVYISKITEDLTKTSIDIIAGDMWWGWWQQISHCRGGFGVNGDGEAAVEIIMVQELCCRSFFLCSIVAVGTFYTAAKCDASRFHLNW